MVIFCKTRTQARQLASNGRKLLDNGTSSPKRWAVELKSKAL